MSLDSKLIIRNFNLYLLSDIELEEPFLDIYNDLNIMFKGLKFCGSDNSFWSNRVVYYGHSKDDLYIKYDEVTGYIWLPYDKVWSVLETKYDFDEDIIEYITTWFIGSTLHLKGTTTTLYPCS